MKKFLLVGFVVGLLALGNSTYRVGAEMSHGTQESLRNFMLDLLEPEISRAVSNYYKQEVGVGSRDSILIMYGHNGSKGVVEMEQSGKDHELAKPYVVKVKVTPQKKGILGKDTITFGVSPLNTARDLQITVLDYKHVAP